MIEKWMTFDLVMSMSIEFLHGIHRYVGRYVHWLVRTCPGRCGSSIYDRVGMLCPCRGRLGLTHDLIVVDAEVSLREVVQLTHRMTAKLHHQVPTAKRALSNQV